MSEKQKKLYPGFGRIMNTKKDQLINSLGVKPEDIVNLQVDGQMVCKAPVVYKEKVRSIIVAIKHEQTLIKFKTNKIKKKNLVNKKYLKIDR